MSKVRTSEAAVQQAILDYLVMRGAMVIRVNSGAMVQEAEGLPRRFVRFVRWQAPASGLSQPAGEGVSDILCCWGGRFIAVEVKAPGKRGNVSDAWGQSAWIGGGLVKARGKRGNVSDAQIKFLAAVEAAGGVALVADSVEDVEVLLNSLEET